MTKAIDRRDRRRTNRRGDLFAALYFTINDRQREGIEVRLLGVAVGECL